METSRTTASSSAAPPEAKRRRTAGDGDGEIQGRGEAKVKVNARVKDPRSIAIWNCNGLAPRVKGHPKSGCPGGGPLHRLVEGLRRPDVICVQEVRLKADGGGGGGRGGGGAGGSLNAGRPHPSEWDEVRHVFESDGDGSSAPFADYVPVWSLCHRRYSGTLTLVRRDLFSGWGEGGGGASPGIGDGSEEWVRDHVAFTVKGAIDLMLKCHGVEKADLEAVMRSVDLGGEGGEGTSSAEAARAANGPAQPRQSKLSSFFVRPTASSAASSGRSKPAAREDHHQEGRIQFLRFPSLDVLHTYVPNNGMKTESFAYRRMFDLEVRRLLLSRLKVLELATAARGGAKSHGTGVRPLLWCGDVNVARDYRDGTNWERGEGGAVYEWWTDESKCFAGKGRSNSGATAIVKDPGDVGMPSFTPAERSRFSTTLEQAGLVDVWRQLHPDGLTADHCPLHNSGGGGGMKEKNRWDRAEYTWRGALGVGGNRAKYQGRAQRLDYFLLSEDGYRGGDGVASCEILGWGERKEGLFCGSDHCALLLVLAE